MKKKVLIITLLLIVLISTGITILFIYFNPLLKLKLNGKKEIEIEVNSEYKEKGAHVTGTKNKYKTTGKVNTKKLGEYKLTYKVTAFKTTKKVTRIVKVVDTTKPVINLVDGEITIYQNEEYKEPGYTASDNYDKDLTNKVIVNSNLDNKTIGDYNINYSVTDSSGNKASVDRKVIVKKTVIKNVSGLTYVNGILLVNKKYALPSTYNPGIDPTASAALKKLQAAANSVGHNIPLLSGFRSYSRQKTLYNNYAARDGYEKADTYSARPGHSEHQSGLAFDVGAIDDYYGTTPAGQWLAENCHKYGFIIRYLKGKEHITGYKYEPWHIRYVGESHSTKIHNLGITLEEYLNVV